MQEVAQATFMFEHFPEVMGMLWKRMLHENKKNWRRTYKVSVYFIDVLDFIIKFSPNYLYFPRMVFLINHLS